MLWLGFHVFCSNTTRGRKLNFVERASTKTVDLCYRHRETKRRSVSGVDCEDASWSRGAQFVLQCGAILLLSLSCPGKSAVTGEGNVENVVVMDPRKNGEKREYGAVERYEAQNSNLEYKYSRVV